MPILTLILLLILVDLNPMLTSVSAMMLILVLVFLLPLLLQKGIVMLTLTGILAFIEVWMFLILLRKLYSYTANKIQL